MSTKTEQDLRRALAVQIGSKSVILAYVLWLFLGFLGVHRMYLGKVASGVVMAALTLIGWSTIGVVIGIVPLLIVLVWWILDAVLILFAARQHNRIHRSLLRDG